MDLLFRPEKYELAVETIELKDESIVSMIELFVYDTLSQNGKEVFYSYIDDLVKEMPNLDKTEIVKEALYRAVLGEMSVKMLKKGLEEIEKNPETWKAE